MARIHTTRGETHTGRTVGSIIRREFGRKAFLKPSADPNSPFAGQVVTHGSTGVHGAPHAYQVLATLSVVDGDRTDAYDPELGAAELD